MTPARPWQRTGFSLPLTPSGIRLVLTLEYLGSLAGCGLGVGQWALCLGWPAVHLSARLEFPRYRRPIAAENQDQQERMWRLDGRFSRGPLPDESRLLGMSVLMPAGNTLESKL